MLRRNFLRSTFILIRELTFFLISTRLFKIFDFAEVTFKTSTPLKNLRQPFPHPHSLQPPQNPNKLIIQANYPFIFLIFDFSTFRLFGHLTQILNFYYIYHRNSQRESSLPTLSKSFAHPLPKIKSCPFLVYTIIKTLPTPHSH